MSRIIKPAVFELNGIKNIKIWKKKLQLTANVKLTCHIQEYFFWLQRIEDSIYGIGGLTQIRALETVGDILNIKCGIVRPFSPYHWIPANPLQPRVPGGTKWRTLNTHEHVIFICRRFIWIFFKLLFIFLIFFF